MKQPLKFLLSIGLMVLSIKVAFADTQTLIVSEGGRLEATIAQDVMNRLTVANDRIVNVFGDEGTFVTQTDDQTGQVFIKPTAENGLKPLSITIITENNVTQDLSLTPMEGSAATIILKNLNPPLEMPNSMSLPSQSSDRNASIPEQMIQTLKKAALGELDPYTKKRMIRKAPNGFKLIFDKAFQSGSFLVSVWQIKDSNKSPDEIKEKNFYQKGDLVLSLRLVDNKTYLFVLQRKK